MLELDDVTLRLGPTFALRNCSLRVDAARTIALVGPSGCGKSTILRLASGLLKPDSGRIVLAGQSFEPANASALRRRLGFVLQEGGLFPHLSAGDNVTLMARYVGWSESQVAARLQMLLELVHLTDEHMRRRPSQLSGGERQRVSLARALMLDPDLLLLDEPLGALDPIVRHDLQRELRELIRRLRKAVLVVTHDVAEAGYLADELVIMRDGRIIQSGTLAQLIEAPADDFVARFVSAQRQLADVIAELA